MTDASAKTTSVEILLKCHLPRTVSYSSSAGEQVTKVWRKKWHARKELTMSVPAYCFCQVKSTFTGMSFLIGMVSSEGGSILKSVSLAGIVPVSRFSLPVVEI